MPHCPQAAKTGHCPAPFGALHSSAAAGSPGRTPEAPALHRQIGRRVSARVLLARSGTGIFAPRLFRRATGFIGWAFGLWLLGFNAENRGLGPTMRSIRRRRGDLSRPGRGFQAGRGDASRGSPSCHGRGVVGTSRRGRSSRRGGCWISAPERPRPCPFIAILAG